MDAYLKLEWSKQHRRSELRLLEYFAIDFGRYEEDIFNLHINETDPVHQLGDVYTDVGGALEFPVDPRTGLEVRQLELDTTRPFRLYDRFPSGSNLNRADHQHCLAVQNRLNMRLGFESAEEIEALAKYRSLTGKLKKERLLFDSFVKSYFLNNLAGRKRLIDGELDELVVRVWKSKVGRMLERMAGKYQLATAVMWLKYRKNEKNVTFEPASENVLELGCVKNIFTENLLHASTLRRSKRVLDRYFEEYRDSRDVDDAVHVDTILRQDEDVRFVMNSGALNFLLGQACNLEQRWTIPFRIDSVNGRSVVFIEKKLQPTRMLTHERNVQAHKYLVRSFMTMVKKDGVKVQTEQESTTNVKIEYKAVGFDEYLEQFEAKKKSMEPVERNVSLQLWNLQDGDDQFRFLIRSRTDCYESLRKVKFYINISIKLEYQTEFGAEQMTVGELIREWTRQRLRPNSKTLRLRINACNHIIISHHYLELRDIEEELKRLYDIEPQNLLTNLWQTLRLLMQFPPGEHLLQHDTKNPETVMILSQSPNATTLDLHQLYSSVEYERCALEEYDWVPIDKTVITKLHREHTLLPGTFPHWNQRNRIMSREKLKPKRPPPKAEAIAAAGKAKKKKSKAKRIRQKQKEKEKRVQKAFETTVQKSLDQFAPYEGPSRQTLEATPAKQAKPAPAAISFVKGESFDYQAYVNQANAKKDE